MTRGFFAVYLGLFVAIVALSPPVLAGVAEADRAALLAEIDQLKAALAACQGKAVAAQPIIQPVTITMPPPPALVVVPSPPDYRKTGCGGIGEAALWKDAEAWSGLAVGMDFAEVEALLGLEHFTQGEGATQRWEYGKCGKRFQGALQFVEGKLQGWKAPSF